MDMLQLLEEFMAGDRRNAWLHTPTMDMYVRKGYHVIPDYDRSSIGWHCLDIASVTLRRQPHPAYLMFMLGLPKVMAAHPEWTRIVYVENTLLPGLVPLYLRLGYKQVRASAAPSFYKVFPLKSISPQGVS